MSLSHVMGLCYMFMFYEYVMFFLGNHVYGRCSGYKDRLARLPFTAFGLTVRMGTGSIRLPRLMASRVDLLFG